MKSITTYILESNIEELRKSIIDAINSITDEKFLKKINKSVSLSNIEDYNKVKSNIEEYLKTHAGIDSSLAKTLIQKIKHYGCLQELNSLINAIKEGDSKKYKYFTDETLTSDGNIINDIKNFAKDIIDIDDNFEEFLTDIATFNLGKKVAAGKFEHLTSIFMQNLNQGNNKLENKPVCDINSVNYGFEYKEEGARITGNKNSAKALSAEVITKTCIELTIEAIETLYNIDDNNTDTTKNKNQFSSMIRNNDDLDKELDAQEQHQHALEAIYKLQNKKDIFKNLNEIYNFLDFCLDLKLPSSVINKIVVLSFISQVPNSISAKDKDVINFLIDKTSPVQEGKVTRDKKGTKGNGDSAHRILFLWLITNLYNYYKAEKFDYLVLFKKDLSGEYITIPFDENITIQKLYDLTIDRIWCNATPVYTGGANSQNSAPMIRII